MVTETRNVFTIVKRDITKGNIFKKSRKKIHNINNDYSRVKIPVRPKRY